MENVESDGTDLVRKDVSKLLGEYADCARGASVKVEFVDLASVKSRNLVESAMFLPAKAILLKYANGRKFIAIEELYDVRNGEVVGFRGERVLTDAIGDLVTEKKKTIYFLTGHGECDVTDVSVSYGLSTLANILRGKNYDVKILDLNRSFGVPDDVDLVALWGPKVALLPAEVLALKKFLDERGGKIMVGLGGANDAVLTEFFADHGIYANLRDKISPLIDSARILHDLVINKYAQHKITRELINFKVPVVCGETYEVREADWTVEDDQFAVTDLLQVDVASEVAGSGSQFIIAALSEKRMSIAVDILAGKLLVFGCSDFAINSRINILGNRMLFCGAVDYMCGVDDSLDIDSFPIPKYRLTLTERQYFLITVLSCAVCCGFVAIGVVVYLLRRK
jgi:hypothetical protein